MKKSRLVVFGATGFIGSHAAQQAALAGDTVICPVRPGSHIGFLQQLPVTLAGIDFSQDQAIAELIRPGDRVINCIADTRMHISDADRRQTDVALTCRLLQLALQQKAACFVQLSSVMAFGFDDHNDRPLDEDSPCHGSYAYNRIAIEREAALRDSYYPCRTRLTLVRPATVLGERDNSFLPGFLPVYQRGFFPVVNGGKQAFAGIDARDAGRMLQHLSHHAGDGVQLYVGKGYTTDWQALKAVMDKVTGRQSRLVNMPGKPLMFVARLMEALYPYGSEPPLTRFSVAVLSRPMCLNDDKIKSTGFTALYHLEDSLFAALDAGRRQSLNKPQ